MRGLAVVFLLCSMVLLCGCKTITPEAKEDLAKPVNCSTAAQDIQALEAEKASTAKKIGAGIRMIVPTTAVVGILSGDYGNRVNVATGQYNKDIDAKIQEIRSSCGMK